MSDKDNKAIDLRRFLLASLAAYMAGSREYVRKHASSTSPRKKAMAEELRRHGWHWEPSAWFQIDYGRFPTNTEQAAISRAIRALADEHLVKLHISPAGRIVMAKLTQAGEVAADAIIGDERSEAERKEAVSVVDSDDDV